MYSGDDQTGVDYDEDLFSDDDDGPTGYGNFLPSFSVARYLTEEKNSQIGLVAGILGVGQGAALFATGTINESFEWVASIELVEYFSDMLIDDANDDSNYESDDEFVGAVRASIQYSF